MFLVAAAIVPGKDIELNEGIRLLTGKAKISLPLKKKEEPKPRGGARTAPRRAAPTPAPAPAPVFSGPVTTACTVVEGETTRRFRITIEPPAGMPLRARRRRPAVAAACAPDRRTGRAEATPVFSPFEGKTELVEIKVQGRRHGDRGPGGRGRRGHEGQARRAGAARRDGSSASTPRWGRR